MSTIGVLNIVGHHSKTHIVVWLLSLFTFGLNLVADALTLYHFVALKSSNVGWRFGMSVVIYNINNKDARTSQMPTCLFAYEHLLIVAFALHVCVSSFSSETILL